MRSLDLRLGLGLFASVCIILALFPYSRWLKFVFRHLVHREPLVIERFDCHFGHYTNGILIHSNDQNVIPRRFILKESAFMLSWKVKGAWRVDLEPVGRDLRGDTVKIVLRPEVRKFTLMAYGLFGKSAIRTLELPDHLVYSLETHEFGSLNLACRPLREVTTTAFTNSTVLNLDFVHNIPTKITMEPLTSKLEVMTTCTDPDRLLSGFEERKWLRSWLQKRRISPNIKYSTSSYPPEKLNNVYN
jgi:hypothetical protein